MGNIDLPPSGDEGDGAANDPVESLGTDRPGSTDEEGAVPNPDTGAGIGADPEANTFEPEEDPDATSEPE